MLSKGLEQLYDGLWVLLCSLDENGQGRVTVVR